MGSDHQHSRPARMAGVPKRTDTLHAARRLFGRDGYARTSIDAIAAEAGVSTRTIYNHFAGKEDLFSVVIEESSTEVAEALLAVIERHLGAVRDLEADLNALARAWVATLGAFPEHFAMVRQIKTESPHFPAWLRERWERTGPRRVEGELARRFRDLAEQRMLRVEDAGRTASHYLWLSVGEILDRTGHGAVPLASAEVDRIVSSGVHAFLHGYLPPHERS